MDDKLIAEIARELFDRDSYHGYNKATRDHQWMLGQTRYIRTVEHVVARALQALEGAWQPISEAPRDGTKIDVWSRDARYTDVFWSDIQEWWCIEGDYGPEEPTPLHVAPAITHFKSLPDPPRDEPIDGDRSREAKPILPKPIEGRGP